MRTNIQGFLLVIVVLGSLFITDVYPPPSVPEIERANDLSFTEAVSLSAFPQLTPAITGRNASGIVYPPISRRLSISSLNLAFGTAGKSAPPAVKAAAALAADLDTGFEFFVQNGESRWPIASLTKLMTALVVSQEIGGEPAVPISESAAAAEGNAGGFSAGEMYSVNDLVKSMMAVSSNDAAVALAEFYGTGKFVDKMNSWAENLGMNQTKFVDPSGLSIINQSTAADLRKLSKFIFNLYPEILSASRQTSTVIKAVGGAGQKERLLVNINKLAGQPDFLGGKTGTLEEAQQNLISLFRVDDRRILVVVLGAENRFEETRIILGWVKEVYGF